MKRYAVVMFNMLISAMIFNQSLPIGKDEVLRKSQELEQEIEHLEESQGDDEQLWQLKNEKRHIDQGIAFVSSYEHFIQWHEKIISLSKLRFINGQDVQLLSTLSNNLKNEMFTSNDIIPLVRMGMIQLFIEEKDVQISLIDKDLVDSCFGVVAGTYERLPFISGLEDKDTFAAWLYNILHGNIRETRSEIYVSKLDSTLSHKENAINTYYSFMKELYAYAQTTKSFKSLKYYYSGE
jgi:hypothetical protein